MSTVLEPSAVDLAYAAGIIDGEGCICVRRHSGVKSMRLELVIGMCSPVVIDWLFSTFPMGRRYIKKRSKKNHRDCELFHAGNLQATAILEMVLPYLKLKRKQAELAIELTNIKRNGRPYHPGNYPRQLEICDEMKILNKRGQEI